MKLKLGVIFFVMASIAKAQMRMEIIAEIECKDCAQFGFRNGKVWACTNDKEVIIGKGYRIEETYKRETMTTGPGRIWFKNSRILYAGLSIIDLRRKIEIQDGLAQYPSLDKKTRRALEKGGSARDWKYSNLLAKERSYGNGKRAFNSWRYYINYAYRTNDNRELFAAVHSTGLILWNRKAWKGANRVGKRHRPPMNYEIVSLPWKRFTWFEKIILNRRYVASIIEEEILVWPRNAILTTKPDTLRSRDVPTVSNSFIDMDFCGNRLVALDSYGQLTLWDMRSKELLFKTDERAAGKEPCFGVYPSKKLVVTGSYDASVKIWVIEKKSLQLELEIMTDGPVTAISFDKKGERIFVQTKTKLFVYKLFTLKGS